MRKFRNFINKILTKLLTLNNDQIFLVFEQKNDNTINVVIKPYNNNEETEEHHTFLLQVNQINKTLINYHFKDDKIVQVINTELTYPRDIGSGILVQHPALPIIHCN